MEFIKYIDNKEIITEAFAEVEAVEEGWGYALADYLTFVGGTGAGLAIGSLAGPVGGVIGAGVGAGVAKYSFDKYIRSNLDKLLKEKPIAKYIKDTCDKILAKKKKELKDNSLTKDFSWKWNSVANVDELPGFMDSLKHTIANTKDFEALAKVLDGYHLYIMYDSDHIQRIIFYAKSKKTDKIYGWTVPAPTKEDLKKLFHKE